jgi:predicted enzyme related to lactoylglutathione lyase
MGKPVTWFEIIAKDAAKSQAFYAELFGWKIDASNPMKYGVIDTGTSDGIKGGIGQAMPQMPVKGLTFYVQVDDVDSYLKKAEKLGGKTAMPKFDVPMPDGPTIAVLTDPDGNTVGLLQAPKKS